MRNAIYKVLPFALGGFTGWLLTHPPAWLRELGPMAWGVHGALCLGLLLSIVALVILGALPAQLAIEPLPHGPIPDDLRQIADRLAALGFRPAGPPRRVCMSPAATLLPFVHGSEPVYATAFRTGTVPAKTSFDFVSILGDERGGLTTGADPAGAVLPEGTGSLRQVFPGASLEKLYGKHLEALGWLRQQGIAARAVSAGTFERDFTAAIARQRSTFLAAPLRGTLVTLWRAASKRVPFVGPLRDQRVARHQVGRLLVG
jgi:hypothetical protein